MFIIKVFACVIISLILCAKVSNCANILMISNAGTKSHNIPFRELAKGLVSRGHHVTLISAYPPESKMEGLEEINPPKLIEVVEEVGQIDILYLAMEGKPGIPLPEALEFMTNTCAALVESEEIFKFTRKEVQVDLLIMDSIIAVCPLGLAEHLNVPFIYLNTISYCLNYFYLSGYPSPEAVNPFFNFAYTNEMTFLQRAHNSLFHRGLYLIHEYLAYRVEKLYSKLLMAEAPVVMGAASKVSFIFQNTHTAVTSHGPYYRNVVNIGGIHLKKAKLLPKDLEDFIQSDEDGFIYFSLGTSVVQSAFPEKLKQVVLKAFAKTNIKVIWKWSGKNITDVPENILVRQWLPQQDILAHPKIKLFITNGGIHSTLETIYHGVPAIFLPVYADQLPIAKRAEEDGYGIRINLAEISSVNLYLAIKEVITNAKYKNRVLKIQKHLIDNFHTPLEVAVYWTEYVLKNSKLPHMKAHYTNYSLIQYYSIDVIALLFLLAIVTAILSFKLAVVIFCYIKGSYGSIRKYFKTLQVIKTVFMGTKDVSHKRTKVKSSLRNTNKQ